MNRLDDIKSALAILITDDDDGDRKQVLRALRRAGISCECVETDSIDSALAVCKEKRFDVAVVDYRLPGRDGLDGIEAMHRTIPTMFIVMATSQGDATVATEAMKRGASDYIAKEHINERSIGRILRYARKKAAMQLALDQQREELERFADVLVHDLKSPISSIRGFASIISHAVKSGKADPAKIADYCGRMVQLGERMVALVETLHEYTKSDAHVVFEPVNLNLVVEDTLSNLGQIISNRGAKVTHDDLPVVFGHAPLLTQLLQNLIGNGIKYCEAAAPTLHVSATPEKADYWRISVRDNGIGIAPEFHQQIFEPFKRLHGRDEFEGTGLGLATCRKIVDRHNGRIWCESNLDGGTTFNFTLPVPTQSPQAQGGGKTPQFAA
ncbi:ATP-binding protein [Bradyrhizobium oligotrophicum]|uniref:sensor histidine kinase n=1 Tax=Bradyrhizobium oligotrophicum TaxID=44255 RepID=UPI003EBB37BA